MSEKPEGCEVALEKMSGRHLSYFHRVLHDAHEWRRGHLFKKINYRLFCRCKGINDFLVDRADDESVEFSCDRRIYARLEVKHRQRPVFAFLGMVNYSGTKITAECTLTFY